MEFIWYWLCTLLVLNWVSHTNYIDLTIVPSWIEYIVHNAPTLPLFSFYHTYTYWVAPILPLFCFYHTYTFWVAPIRPYSVSIIHRHIELPLFCPWALWGRLAPCNPGNKFWLDRCESPWCRIAPGSNMETQATPHSTPCKSISKI